MIDPLPGVFNQKTWPGVGDIDDCQVITALWCLQASGTLTHAELPSVASFRHAAGVPDLPGPTGLTNAQSLLAALRIAPASRAFSYVGAYTGFVYWLAQGAVASLSVVSAHLTLPYGFAGNHQVGIALPHGLVTLIMNPLDTMGHQLEMISEANLRKAAEAIYNDGKFHAVIYPAKGDTHDAQIAALTAKISKAKAALA
jgi:hypothetical protein